MYYRQILKAEVAQYIINISVFLFPLCKTTNYNLSFFFKANSSVEKAKSHSIPILVFDG